MKTTRRILAMVLCVILALTMATTAFAANVVNETDHSYELYQIFTGTQADGSVELGNVQWGSGVNGPELLAELQTTSKYSACTTAAGVAAILAADSPGMDKDADAREFANIVRKYLTTTVAATIGPDQTSVDLPTGYYLVVDVTNPGEGDAKNPALLQVTNAGDVKIAQKYDVPVPDKMIKVGDTLTTHTAVGVGQDVNFVLSGTIATNYDDFVTYKYVFHDVMSKGLAYKDITPNAKVYVINGSGSSAVKTEISSYFTITTADGGDGKTNLTVACNDLKKIVDAADKPLVNADSDIVVEYTAVVTEDAVINGENPNDVRIEYSNNPDWEPNPSLPDDYGPTGYTPWKTVKVYPTEVKLIKKDGTTKNRLTGAKFRIEGTSIVTSIQIINQYTAYAAGEELVTGNVYWKLKDGTFTPTDPATLADKSAYADTETKYKNETIKNPITVATDVFAEEFVGADGELKFSGLGAGDYTITEVHTPAGYNTITPITLKISYTGENTFSYHWGGGASGASNEVVIDNFKGSTLPETGGMGTTLFYIFGGVMVLGAAVLLITKKRMRIAE